MHLQYWVNVLLAKFDIRIRHREVIDQQCILLNRVGSHITAFPSILWVWILLCTHIFGALQGMPII